MHSPVIILTMISIAYAGTIAPSSLNGKMLKEQLVNEQSTVYGATSPVQNNNPPPSSHIYPTYPVYSSNTQAVARTEYDESYLTPAAAPVQKTVQKTWSYENIISSLIPFTTSLVIYSARAGTFLLHFLMVILVGVASTSMICIHTSICDTFMGKIKVKELARMYITPENLDIATTMVSKALDKHSST